MARQHRNRASRLRPAHDHTPRSYGGRAHWARGRVDVPGRARQGELPATREEAIPWPRGLLRGLQSWSRPTIKRIYCTLAPCNKSEVSAWNRVLVAFTRGARSSCLMWLLAASTSARGAWLRSGCPDEQQGRYKNAQPLCAPPTALGGTRCCGGESPAVRQLACRFVMRRSGERTRAACACSATRLARHVLPSSGGCAPPTSWRQD